MAVLFLGIMMIIMLNGCTGSQDETSISFIEHEQTPSQAGFDVFFDQNRSAELCEMIRNALAQSDFHDSKPEYAENYYHAFYVCIYDLQKQIPHIDSAIVVQAPQMQNVSPSVDFAISLIDQENNEFTILISSPEHYLSDFIALFYNGQQVYFSYQYM